ncbi:hemicentin-1-like isoform X2 [Dendronephthya gigantea]|uniref:hemicentin-1-like isoform X2 n=1 Tax=Dendronephthya gigantea TaxID=151771 RepID=UPI001068DC14|nr:hemicentin-1-like isoform X2 [Dendronephthya gigantea]
MLNCRSPVMLNEGDNFTCLCKGEGGSPPAKVVWFNDGVNVSLVGTKNQALKLLNVSKEDNGTYTCNATSYPHENYTDEKSIVVIVYIIPNVTTDCDSSMAVNEGVDVTCYCECKGGNPPANCTWFKNGILTGKIGLKENTLNRPNIKRTDGGNYTCVGESHSSAMAKKLTTITVYYVEVNFYSPNNDSVTITCTSNGPPLLDYTIYHNGTKVARNMSYIISTVNGTHPGLYNCTATNGLGELSAVKFLDAKRKTPSTTQQIQSTIQPSTAQPLVPSTTSKVVVPDDDDDDDDDEDKTDIGLIVGVVVGVVALIVIVFCAVLYFKSKARDNKRGHADVNPNGSRVMTNHYELDEDHGEDAGAYDTVKQSDDGEGSQDRKKPAGDSLPPVYASVNKDNRQGNTVCEEKKHDFTKS